jgi:hypothetical protein
MRSSAARKLIAAHLLEGDMAPGAGGEIRSSTLIVSLGIVTAPFHLFTIELAVGLLTLLAIAQNRLAGLDYPLWAPRGPAPGGAARS